MIRELESNKYFSRKKILESNPNIPWMDTMVLNPAIIKKDGILHMLFRATGSEFVKNNKFGNNSYPIGLGYGYSLDDGENWTFDFSRPVLAPACEKEIDKIYIKNIYGDIVPNYSNGSIEDPRLFFLEGKCYLTIACRMFPPGAYWIFDSPTQCAPDWIKGKHPFGRAASENVTVSVLYEVDLDALYHKQYDIAFKYITNLTYPEYSENRDVIFFPKKLLIDGKMQYVMLERPVYPYLNPIFSERKPSIVISAADDFRDFAKPDHKKQLFATPKYEWENNRIGASSPLVELNDNYYLLNYHGKQDDEYGYTQSFMILKVNDNSFPEIVYRNADGVISVYDEWEKPNKFTIPCIFVTGMIKENDNLIFSYGAADEYCGIMKISIADLFSILKIKPEDLI